MLDSSAGVGSSGSDNTVNGPSSQAYQSNQSSHSVDSVSNVTPARGQEIDQWVQDNAHAEDTFAGIGYDDAGGERVSKALNGESSLGLLTSSEKRYLVESATTKWRISGNTENIREAAENLQSPETRSIVAGVYAEPAAVSDRILAEGGQVLSSPEGSAAATEMLSIAVELDSGAVINAYDGIEGALGRSAGVLDGNARGELLNRVASGEVSADGDGISKMVTAIFLKSESSELANSNYRQAMSGALAQVMVNRDGASGAELQGNINTLSSLYNDILSSSGGRDLLANDAVAPELRGWAMAEIASNPSWNAQSLQDGWDSGVVSSSYANEVVVRYQSRGVEPQVLGGEALRNTIGQALGVRPDRLPAAHESPAEEQSRLDAGLNHQYYGANPRIDAIATKVQQLGGENAEVSIMPVTVTNDEFGAATFNVFKIQGEDGKTYFVEDADPTRHYTGFDDWRENSRLPPGQMTYVKDMEWGGANTCPVLTTEATPLVTDTFGEWARKIGDGVALGAGIIAGGVIIVGSGGTGAFVVAGIAGAYTTARAGEGLYDAQAHGVDISDLSNAEVRANWIDVAAGTLSFGAMGAAKFATLARGAGTANVAARGAAGLEIAANTADAAAATNQAYDLATNWDRMGNADRAMGLLNIAFWGGMTAASTRAGGAPMADAYSFSRLSNHLEFGSPYPVSQNTDLPSGQMRVAYDTGANGRAANIRIEHGGATPDAEMLDLHSRTARQMEASGGLLDRISTHLQGGQQAPVGSAAWEAQLELNKIGLEAQSISQGLANPDITPDQRAELQVRLEELETATAFEADRLGQLEQLGEGWIAAPARGAIQARDKGWPEAPEGYVWVAGASVPHLRRLDPSDSSKMYYDEASGKFSETVGMPPMQRVGHGENKVDWKPDESGQIVEVTATLREYYNYAKRSSAELSAQGVTTRTNGIEGDHAGHIIGHRFVLDQGLKNLFPQDANLNTGAYKTLENELADWIAAGCNVKINVKLNNYQNGRPTEIEVSYRVFDTNTGKQVHRDIGLFANESNQSFNRLGKAEIDNLLAISRGTGGE
ncbi:DUF4781 domain-containing protein [Hahella ganghwensis]|uniref:DUF4781 domain-containing protein n=1 Tax=Hahella ganghwensis TaxID=286420 RepID=UPI000363E7E0|nr:DUF4781 domain-containing protein [Hahella ganghwensis]